MSSCPRPWISSTPRPLLVEYHLGTRPALTVLHTLVLRVLVGRREHHLIYTSLVVAPLVSSAFRTRAPPANTTTLDVFLHTVEHNDFVSIHRLRESATFLSYIALCPPSCVRCQQPPHSMLYKKYKEKPSRTWLVGLRTPCCGPPPRASVGQPSRSWGSQARRCRRRCCCHRRPRRRVPPAAPEGCCRGRGFEASHRTSARSVVVVTIVQRARNVFGGVPGQFLVDK